MNIKIGNKQIGEDFPCFIVAELSANHNQSFELAAETIKAAKQAGADAIKLQTYTADTLTIDSDEDFFRIEGTIWDGNKLYDLYKEAYTPWDWQPELKKIAEAESLECFSSAFDNSAVDFLEGIDVPAYKIASAEITDIALIEYIASKQKPVILSTGMAAISDIELAIKICRDVGNDKIIILKCSSTYPTVYEEINLRSILSLKETFDTLVGLSDHSLGIEVAIASIPFGAKVIEKHFILDRSIGGPDAFFSVTPEEFEHMVGSIRNVEKAMGEKDYKFTDKMKESRRFCRSLFVVEDIKKGELFSNHNVRSIRPGDGLHPRYLKDIYGKKSKCDIKKGTPLSWDHILKDEIK